MRKSLITFAAAAVCFSNLLCPTDGFAQSARERAQIAKERALARRTANNSVPFKIGDRVEKDWGSDVLTGTVKEIDKSSGWVTVEHDDKAWGTHKWPASFLRAGKPKKRSASATAKGAAADNPFETPEERGAKAGPRTWTDATGKHKIQGTMLRFENDKVTLKRTDGKEVTLAVDKLKRKYLAVPVKDGIAIVDAMAGKMVGHLPGENVGSETLEQRLAWLDRDHVLVDGQWVFDVPCRVAVWQYTSLTPACLVRGGRLWYVASGASREEQILASSRIPDEEAWAPSKGLQPDDLLVIKPGTKVSIDLQLGSLGQQRSAMLEKFKKQLEAGGLEITTGGDVKLIVRITPGETKKLMYRPWGSLQTMTQQVTEQKAEVAYLVKNKSVWSYKTVYLPTFIRVQEKDTFQTALNRTMQESVAQLGNTWIPKYVAALPEGKSSGSSETPPGG